LGIATAGRPEVVARTIALLARQTRQPDTIIICVPAGEAPRGLGAATPAMLIIEAPRGLPAQRNAILDALGPMDVVLFLDDDFVAAPDYLAETEAAFLSHPDLVMTTGRVLADGIRGPGLTFEAAEALIASPVAAQAGASPLRPVPNGYGCNMAVRLNAVRATGLRFDEALPLYGWLEDLDFGRRLAQFGRVARLDAARGVHLGVKSGRQAGRRLGYSQIANPLYLVRKGSCPVAHAAHLMIRNVGSNLLRSLRPEPYMDRRGRLAGNLAAVMDLLRGRLHPTRIVTL
jgi:GT2 family glycosyltransferase